MATETTEYAPDEFDLKAAEVQHRGVHRAKVTRWQSMRPYFFVAVAAIVVVAAAYAFIRVNDQAERPQAAGQPSSSSGAAVPGGPAAEPAGPEPVAQPTVVAPDPNVAVIVSNAGTVSGMASKVQAALVEHGWSVPIINSTPVTGVTASTVVYSDDQFKAQAEAVAVRLGIKNVVKNAALGDAVNVQILNDFGDTVPQESTTVVTAGAQPAAPATAPGNAAATVTPDPAVAVSVVNANGAAGLASTIVGGLQASGWASAYANGNAAAAATTVVYYPTAAQAGAAATIAKTVSGTATTALDASRTQITVVVGTDFKP